MLTDKQCSIINRHLTENVEPRKVAAYLCLNMGLLLGEVTALRRQDIDIDAGVLHIRNVAGRGGRRNGVVTRWSLSRRTRRAICPCRRALSNSLRITSACIIAMIASL